MIFLTLGTQHPFDRLVKLVDKWAAANPHENVFGQIPCPKSAGYTPVNFDWVETLEPSAYKTQFETASLVIAHAGMGSIITAQSLCKPIVIFPRRAALGEHRNDHQIATAKRFGDRPGVFAPLDDAEFIDTLNRASAIESTAATSPIAPFADDKLTNALRASIFQASGKPKRWRWLPPIRARLSGLVTGE